jgi:hypothetical protein
MRVFTTIFWFSKQSTLNKKSLKKPKGNKNPKIEGQTTQWPKGVWRYQRGNQNPYIEEDQKTQWPKEKGQKNKQINTAPTPFADLLLSELLMRNIVLNNLSSFIMDAMSIIMNKNYHQMHVTASHWFYLIKGILKLILVIFVSLENLQLVQ